MTKKWCVTIECDDGDLDALLADKEWRGKIMRVEAVDVEGAKRGFASYAGSGTTEKMIIELFATTPRPRTATEVTAEIGGKQSTVHHVLGGLVADGVLVRDGLSYSPATGGDGGMTDTEQRVLDSLGRHGGTASKDTIMADTAIGDRQLAVALGRLKKKKRVIARRSYVRLNESGGDDP